MLKYLLVVLSEDATSFCHYEGKPGRGLANELIPLDKLEKAVTFALKNNLKVNFLYPARKLNRAYDDVIDGVDHVKIVPFAVRERYPQAILVVESAGFPAAESLKKLRGANVILRLRRADLPKLAVLAGRLLPRTTRINLVLADLESFGPEDLAAYGRELEKLRRRCLAIAPGRPRPEINVLTDRLALDRMNNCEAGLTHLTVAPDGRLYLCPAFYGAGAAESLGEIRNEIAVPNRHLLELRYAPICRVCDAFQCRRCIHLNRRLTLEVNTPSFQQCRAAHVEREASRLYLKALRERDGAAAGQVEIPEVPYDDPFDVVLKAKTTIAEFQKMRGSS